MLLLAVNSGGLKAATKLPGFPTHSFVSFALAVAFIQGALFATVNAGTDLARDIQTGFLSRLTLTPMRPLAVLGGQLGGALVIGFAQAVVYIAVGLAVGVRFKWGRWEPPSCSCSPCWSCSASARSAASPRCRTGSGEAVQGLFPVFFVFLFISSMNLPRNLMEVDWFRAAATANPVSYLLENIRGLIITGWDGEALGLGFGIALLLVVVSLALASWALKERMAR